MSAPAQPLFPVSYTQIAREICEERQVDADIVLRDIVGLTEIQREDPTASLSREAFTSLLGFMQSFATENARHQRLLIEFFPPTIHGNVALAAITSARLDEAMQISLRFAHLVMPAYDMSYDVAEDRCRLAFDRIVSVRPHDDLLAELVFCAFHSFLRIFGHERAAMELHLTHGALVLTELPSIFPEVKVKLGRARNRLEFAADLLESAIPTRNHATRRIIEAALERDAARLRGLVTQGRVRQAILQRLEQGLPVDTAAVASELGLSTRTLSRRLTEEGTSYRETFNELRVSLARELLCAPGARMAEVAHVLGFSDEGNFSRFFCAQTGERPSVYRARFNPSEQP